MLSLCVHTPITVFCQEVIPTDPELQWPVLNSDFPICSRVMA